MKDLIKYIYIQEATKTKRCFLLFFFSSFPNLVKFKINHYIPYTLSKYKEIKVITLGPLP